MTTLRDRLQHRAAQLAAQGVFVGTSSWKYEGWLDQLYDRERYAYRGKFAHTRFERDCLAEYAQVFHTVCVDAAYYTFPTAPHLQRLTDQTPDTFQFGFKVTDTITLKRFPKLDRFGNLAGQPNPDFLNPDLFASSFLAPCETIRPRVGILMFEFSRFWPADYERGRDFVADLDTFLSKMPAGWPYAIELRNRSWLQPAYLDCLARHRVAHVFNSWEAMPAVSEQLAQPGTRPNPNLVAARFLLRPGRAYEDAVKSFQPYNRTVEINQEARQAGADLIKEGVSQQGRRTFLFINNRLEGNALSTLDAMMDQALGSS